MSEKHDVGYKQVLTKKDLFGIAVGMIIGAGVMTLTGIGKMCIRDRVLRGRNLWKRLYGSGTNGEAASGFHYHGYPNAPHGRPKFCGQGEGDLADGQNPPSDCILRFRLCQESD